MKKQNKKQGFTLIELSLSLVFIGVLSLTIVLIINNAIGSYRRGLTLNQVNTVGMELVDDMRTVVQNSPSVAPVSRCEDLTGSDKTECINENGYVFFENTAEVMGSNVPVSGAFCTGKYSYVWNSGYYDSDDFDVAEVPRLMLGYNGSGGAKNFRLIKVKDKNAAICAKGSDSFGLIDVADAGISKEDVTELIDSENDLALYDLRVQQPATGPEGSNTFYAISFVLGTLKGGADITATGNYCTVPQGYNSEFNYCAINKFNFAAQATGGKNG